MSFRSWLSGGDDPHPMESDYDALQASAARGSARFAARWGSSDTPDGYDHGLANPMFQADHKAKMKARQARGNGRTHVNIGTSKIDQTDNLDAIIRQHAQPDADKLHRLSPTRANFRDVQPSSWNIEKIKHITFTADRDHGFPTGRAGKVEVLDNYRVRIHR